MEKDFPEYQTISLRAVGRVVWIALNRPDRLNAINGQMLRDIDAALDEIAGRKEIRVVIIKGEGRAFSSGYDLSHDEYAPSDGDIVDDYDILEKNLRYMLRIWDFPKPIIAAVHGYCLAGATQLCVFCDITVVAEDAVIGLPALPAGGGFITPIWTPLVGPKRAKQMSFVPNSRISGKTAAEWGWANYAVPAGDLETNVAALAGDIARVPSKILRMKKMSINRAWDAMGFRTIVPLGAETDALLHHSEECREVGAAIREKGLKGAIAAFNNDELFKD